MISGRYASFPSVSGYFQNSSNRLHTAGVGGSNPLPPTRKDKKSGSELNTLFLIFSVRNPTKELGVQDYIVQGHVFNFYGSMFDNEDGAVKLLQQVVMPLPEKELSMESPEFTRDIQ